MLKQKTPSSAPVPAPKAPLVQAPPLVSDYCGMRNLHIKDCSQLPTGTMKDYRSFEIISHMEPIAERTLFYQITYGNAGYSVGHYCREFNRYFGRERFGVLNIVDKSMDPGHSRLLRESSEVVELDLGRKTLTTESLEEIAFRSGFLARLAEDSPQDKRPCAIDIELFGVIIPHKGLYRRLVEEVAAEGAALIMMPIGSGELYDNFLTFHPFGPALRRNPHLEDRIRGATVPGSILFPTPSGSKEADKLVMPSSRFKLASAWLHMVDDNAIMEAQKILSESGVKTEPSAATAFAALKQIKLRDKDAKVIVINTGCGQFWHPPSSMIVPGDAF